MKDERLHAKIERDRKEVRTTSLPRIKSHKKRRNQRCLVKASCWINCWDQYFEIRNVKLSQKFSWWVGSTWASTYKKVKLTLNPYKSINEWDFLKKY